MKIHCMEDGTVEIYSRNAERNTGKYPDVVNAVSRYAFLLIFTHHGKETCAMLVIALHDPLFYFLRFACALSLFSLLSKAMCPMMQIPEA